MIGAAECRERAAECRQMADGEQSSRVQSILIDMARTWERLALEAEQNASRIHVCPADALPRKVIPLVGTKKILLVARFAAIA